MTECQWCIVALEDGYVACPIHLPRECACPAIAKGSHVPTRPGYVAAVQDGQRVWLDAGTLAVTEGTW